MAIEVYFQSASTTKEKSINMKKNDFRILDLFSGAGGLSLGMHMVAGFKTLIAIDNNASALATFKKNMPYTKIICGDITSADVKREIIEESKKMKINMIIGGPPCQGFSLKGKNNGLSDQRNFLFLEYYRIVEELRPKVFVIENVKNFLNSSNGYFINRVNDLFSKLGYFVNYGILNASNFGVPQHRERTIVIGSLDKNIALPTNFSGDKKYVTVRDAISDLAFLESGEGENEIDYPNSPESAYQQMLRKNSKRLYNHIATNHSPHALYKLSLIPKEKGKEFLPKDLIGKQKFTKTWSRLEWDKISPTIDTRFDTPSNGKNSHPELNRSITPREAARIQSFPDSFIFYGSKTDICKQIGNAVPPLLAKVIAKSISDQISEEFFSGTKASLYNSDSYKIVYDFLKNNLKVNHIITDPPYNISQSNNFDSLSIPRKGIDFGEWDKNFNLYGWIDTYSRIIDKNGSFIIFCSYRFISHIIDRLQHNGFVTKDVIKWIKSNPMPRNTQRRYVQDTEFAVWAVRENSHWTFNKNKNISYLRAEIRTAVVSGKEKTVHPTQKSLELMKEIIKVHTNAGDLILDPFMGSGTTGVACLQLGRRFIGVEINKKYYDISKERVFDDLDLAKQLSQNTKGIENISKICRKNKHKLIVNDFKNE